MTEGGGLIRISQMGTIWRQPLTDLDTQMANSKKRAGCVLAGDVGGTKTDIGFFEAGRTRPIARATATYSSRDADSLDTIVGRMLERHPFKIETACFGIAGPVINGECRATNLPWVVAEKKLARRFGWKQTKLINDLGATAMAIPLLNHREMHPLNNVRIRKKQNIGLVAPGTGLGLAILHYVDGRYRPVASEGGHANFAPSEPEEVDLWRFLRSRFGHVSMERVVSGQGLVNIYDWLKSTPKYSESRETAEAMRRSDSARVISENAINANDPLCIATLQRFCQIFGSIAGDLALTGMTTGGIFLAGGIPPKILPALQRGDFMAAFQDKGRFEEFLRKIPVRVILHDQAALLGAANCALNL